MVKEKFKPERLERIDDLIAGEYMGGDKKQLGGEAIRSFQEPERCG